MKVLSFPMQIDSRNSGSFKYVEFDSDEYKSQQIVGFVKTNKGERPIFQDFGMDDPTFAEFDQTEFLSEFNAFYSNIAINEFIIREREGVIASMTIEFE